MATRTVAAGEMTLTNAGGWNGGGERQPYDDGVVA
jgi:hypothetical protein